jgi:tetratricopeptide (TPR) repeat protein
LRKFIFVQLVLLFFPLAGSLHAQTAVESVLAQISELLAANKNNEAISLFDTIPLPERDSSQLKLLKASVYSSIAKYAEARTIAEAVIKAEPKNIEAFFVLAAIEGASGRRRQQQAALEQVIKIEPNNAEALIELGNISLQNRASRAAASYFHRVLTKEPENLEALLGLSRAFRMNTEWDAAEPLLNRAVELYPAMVQVWTERARFHWGRGNMKLAVEDLNEAKKLDPSDYWIALDQGNLLFDMNKKPEALEEFTRAIAINPAEYRAYVYSAGLKDDLGDHDGAERDYAILAKLKPDYYFALEGLGLHKMRNKKWAEARDAFMEAYRRAPEEDLYALLAAINWMRAEDIAAPRTFLAQAHLKVKRDTLEWYMFRLFYDLTSRNYLGESDMAIRLDREKNEILKARMLFYMAQYYDVRGNENLANKYYLLVFEMNKRAIPEWRLNDWILDDRKIKPF